MEDGKGDGEKQQLKLVTLAEPTSVGLEGKGLHLRRWTHQDMVGSEHTYPRMTRDAVPVHWEVQCLAHT